jgi:hypothetical protein
VGGEPPVPWVVSNPIYVGTTARTIGAEAAPTDARFLYRNGPAAEWTVEHSPRARGAVSVIGAVGGTQVLFRFALGGSTAESPFVALAMPAGSDVTGHDRLAFSGRANRPMRVSVQLRATRGGTEHRWRRSVYLDEEARLVTLPLSDFRPTTPATPVDLPAVTSILFVVDQVNTKLGTSGQIWLDDVRYQREGTTSGR